MTIQTSEPSEIRVTRGGAALEIDWADGASSALSAASLRTASRSASAVRASIDDRRPQPPAEVAITGAEPIGSYALRLFFSDGHDRGIFPWAYLRNLAAA